MRRGTTLNDLMQWDNTLFEGIILPDEVNYETLVSYIMLTCGLQEVVYQDYDVFKSQVHVWFAAHEWNITKLVNLIKQTYEPLWNYNKFEELEGNKAFDGTINTTEARDTSKTGNITTTNDVDKTTTDTHGGSDTTNRTDTFGEVNSRNLTTTNNLQTDTTNQNSTTETETDTHSVTAFNTDAWQPTDKTERSLNRSENGTENETNTGTVTETGSLNKTGENLRADTTNYGKTLSSVVDEQGTRVETHNTLEDRDTTGSEINKNSTKTDEFNHIYGNVGVTTYQKMFMEEFELIGNVNLYEWITNKFSNDLMVGVFV